MWQSLRAEIEKKDPKALARAITWVENEAAGYEDFLKSLAPARDSRIIGITGPPGSGKSTLTGALIGKLIEDGKDVAVLCVDPSSPFNMGAVLGDRIRMSEWYTNQQVYIRSLATRGSLGGLHPKIIEITDIIRTAGFDYVIIETVGVGQSEIEIAGLADTTVVVLVPEAGDEVQTMKAGLMEIADIFVVNKCDRPDADQFVRNLRLMLAPAFSRHRQEIPVIKTIASEKKGIGELLEQVKITLQSGSSPERRAWLLAEKAWQLIVSRRMKDISKEMLKEKLEKIINNDRFNLYSFIENI